MKKVILICLFCCCAVESYSADVLRPEQKMFLQNQRVVVKKDVTTVPGKILIYFNKGGKPDGVMTQTCFKVTSGRNKNPLMIKYINSTNLVMTISNQLTVVRATLQSIKTKNDEAIANLDDLETKHPLLATIIEKIKAKIQIDIEKIKEDIESKKSN